MLSKLLEMHFNINTSNSQGMTALHWAALAGSTSAAHLLVGCQIFCRAVNSDGDTALHLAVRSKSTAITQLLVRVSDIRAKNNEQENLLHVAAKTGHIPTMRIIVE
jgi:ankyrin repeat protein